MGIDAPLDYLALLSDPVKLGVALVGALVTAAILRASVLCLGAYALYIVGAVAALVLGVYTKPIYFFAFLLGALNAFTEIIAKFTDEPLKAFKTTQAFFYHLFNGAMSVFALHVLILLGPPADTPMKEIQLVVIAGLGSMLIMRSKFFDVKVGDQEISVGPEQFVRLFLGFLETAIARARTPLRMDFVARTMHNIDCDKVSAHCIAMLQANQRLEVRARKELVADIRALCSATDQDKQIRSYRLGFVIVDAMGERFVEKLFSNPPPELLIKAPTAAIPQSTTTGSGLLGLRSIFSHKQSEYFWHFAYGTSMSQARFTRRLGWSEKEISDAWGSADSKPRAAVLERYRLTFGKRASADGREGLPSIVEDPFDRVEGVLYRLPQPVRSFLDGEYAGYQPTVVTVAVDGTTMQAWAYIARTDEGLMPTEEVLDIVLAGAAEHGLSQEYIQRLRDRPILEPLPSLRPPVVELPSTADPVPSKPTEVGNAPSQRDSASPTATRTA